MVVGYNTGADSYAADVAFGIEGAAKVRTEGPDPAVC